MQILDKQISTLDVGYGMKSTSIKLDAFISDYIASHPIPLVKYDFSRATTSSDAEGSGEESLSGTIEFPKEALTIIFDNIIANAVSHGFSNDAEHTIRFSVEVEGTNILPTTDLLSLLIRIRKTSSFMVFQRGAETTLALEHIRFATLCVNSTATLRLSALLKKTSR